MPNLGLIFQWNFFSKKNNTDTKSGFSKPSARMKTLKINIDTSISKQKEASWRKTVARFHEI